MRTLAATEARANIYQLIQDVSEHNETIQITSKHGNAILLSKIDWDAIGETLYLLAIPGMRESLHSGLNTPLSDCDTKLEW
jgi:antitoxin YefM